MVCTEVEAKPTARVGREPAGRQEELANVWSACEPVVEDIVRRLVVAGRGVETADVVQHAALAFVEMVTLGKLTSDFTSVEIVALRRELTLRIREFLRSEWRRFGRQVTADEGVLERALARRASRAPSGGPSGRALARAIESLSPRQRAVVAGIYFDDATVAAIASELRVTPQAITALHRRAIATMRKRMVVSNRP